MKNSNFSKLGNLKKMHIFASKMLILKDLRSEKLALDKMIFTIFVVTFAQ